LRGTLPEGGALRYEQERAHARGHLPAGQVYEKQDSIAEALKD